MKKRTLFIALAAIVGLISVISLPSSSAIFQLTPSPQQCTDFESFNLLNNPKPTLPIGTVHGQDGWAPYPPYGPPPGNHNGGWTVSDFGA